MNSLNMHLERHEKPFAVKGEVSKKGQACWLQFRAGGTDVAIFFDNPIELAIFCREHNFPLVDKSVIEEEKESAKAD